VKLLLMKGIIFTEFVEMVEEKFGFVMADNLLNQSALKSEGIYTSVGTYDFQEMIILLKKLSTEINTPIPDLLKIFGNHLFSRFHNIYPHFFEGKTNSFDFLAEIDNYIHVEVLKLYPDAELPSINIRFNEDRSQMEMIYKSERKLSDLAYGLIKGCIHHFKENIRVELENVVADGSQVRIVLTKE